MGGVHRHCDESGVAQVAEWRERRGPGLHSSSVISCSQVAGAWRQHGEIGCAHSNRSPLCPCTCRPATSAGMWALLTAVANQLGHKHSLAMTNYQPKWLLPACLSPGLWAGLWAAKRVKRGEKLWKCLCMMLLVWSCLSGAGVGGRFGRYVLTDSPLVYLAGGREKRGERGRKRGRAGVRLQECVVSKYCHSLACWERVSPASLRQAVRPMLRVALSAPRHSSWCTQPWGDALEALSNALHLHMHAVGQHLLTCALLPLPPLPPGHGGSGAPRS